MGDIRTVLNERQKTHGEYAEHARCTQRVMDALMAERNWSVLSDTQKETLHMIAHKLGRIMVGNPNFEDHYIDIIGYTQLALDRLPNPTDKTGMEHPFGFDPKVDVA